MIVREADTDDWRGVEELFLATPVRSGTAFVLDRRPDFGALPRLRGEFRTFVALQSGRLAGTVTALWRRGLDNGTETMVGEVIDLRVAPWARGGYVAYRLLGSVRELFAVRNVRWVLCLIGNQNREAIAIAARHAGLPPLQPLAEFASVHVMALRLPLASSRVVVRAADAADASVLADFFRHQQAAERFAPTSDLQWPDPDGLHHAWLAFEPDGTPAGALVAWNGERLRRVRIVRYRGVDLPLRAAMHAASVLGLGAALPAPGGVLRLWGTRLVAVRSGGTQTLRALVSAAVAAAAAAQVHVLQLNLWALDPLLRRLPLYPRSVYRTTLYGGPLDERSLARCTAGQRFHGDIARV